MADTTNGRNNYCSGGLGTSRAGVAGVVKQAPAASSSGNCGVSVVASQATVHLPTTGEKIGDPGGSVEERLTSDTCSGIVTRARSRRIRKRRRAGGSSDSPRKGLGSARDSATDSDEEAVRRRETLRNTQFCRSSERALPKTEELRRAMTRESNGGLGGAVLERMAEVERISASSRNLKGTFVRALRVAARETSAAVTELVQRSSEAGEARWLANENAQLRAELQEIKKELAELRRGIRRGAPRGEAAGSPIAKTTPRIVATPVATRGTGADEAGAPAQTIAQRMEGIQRTQREQWRGNRDLTPADAPRVSGPPGGDRTALALREGEGTIQERMVSLMRREMVAMESRLLAAFGSIPQTSDGAVGTYAVVAAAPAPGVRPVAASLAPRPVDGDWRVVSSRAARKKERRRKAAVGGLAVAERAKVMKKGKKKIELGRSASVTRTPATTDQSSEQRLRAPGVESTAGRPRRKEAVLQKPPRTAVVTLTATPQAKMPYAQAMAAARERISLADIGIEGVKPKTSRTGGLILEVRGPGGQEKAQVLADRMAGVLEGSGVRVSRPSKTAELRVSGLDVSVRPTEVAAAVAAAGECPIAAVKVGNLTFGPSGRGSAWVRCPLVAAHRVVRDGRVTVGWCRASVQPLQSRPLQCFRCLELGHTRSGCTSAADRSALCYRCGGRGHRASKCSAAPRCPLCSDLGRPAGHRLGAPSCAPGPVGGRRRRGQAAAMERQTAAGGAPSGEQAPVLEPEQGRAQQSPERSPVAAGLCPMEGGMDLE